MYIQRSKQCWRCQRYATDFNALIAMYVEDIEDGVWTFYATLHTELLILLLMSKVSKVSNTMKNWSKAQNTYKHIFAHNFLNIQPIFNPKKRFEKLQLRAFQPYHQILCILKHVKDVEDRSNTLRAVILCMSKMSKMGKEHTHTFLLITFLIFNWFSIHKKF